MLLRIHHMVMRYQAPLLAGLVALVVGLGTLYSLSLGEHLRFVPDEQDYYTLALNLAQSQRYTLDGVHPTSLRPPGYPATLALFMLVYPSVFTARLVNFLAFGLSIYLVYLIMKCQANVLPALIAAVLVVCYPVLFFTAGILFPQTVGACVFLAVIFLALRGSDAISNYLLAGALFGYLTLIIPTFLPILALMLGWIWFDKPLKKYLAVVMLVAAVVVVGAWTVRNYLVFDRWVLVSTDVGKHLLQGNSEGATATNGSNVDIDRYMDAAASMTEVEQDAYLRSTALRYISEHPLRSAGLYVRKLLNHFHYRNDLWTNSEESQLRDLVMLATYAPLLLLVIGRLLLAKVFALSRFETWFVAIYVLNALISAVFYTRIRYRLPFDYLLIMIAAGVLGRIWVLWIARQQLMGLTGTGRELVHK